MGDGGVPKVSLPSIGHAREWLCALLKTGINIFRWAQGNAAERGGRMLWYGCASSFLGLLILEAPVARPAQELHTYVYPMPHSHGLGAQPKKIVRRKKTQKQAGSY